MGTQEHAQAVIERDLYWTPGPVPAVENAK